MDKQSIVQVTLRANEELIKRTKQKSNRGFYMVGRESWNNIAEEGQKADWQFTGIDFIDVVTRISNNERTVIKFIKDSIIWDKELNSLNYIATLAPDSAFFDPAAHGSIKYETFLKGFNLLCKEDLVRRVRRHQYMFNPDFFIMHGEQTAYFERIWAESKPCK